MTAVTKPLRVVELYAGTARSAEPFRSWSRAEIALLVDNNPLAEKAYKLNYPDAPYVTKSLSRARPDEIRAMAGGQVDVLLGCPPCQGFSDTGLRDAADPRNEHLWRFGVVAEGLRPLAVAMENVPRAAETRRFKLFAERLERAGYRWTARILNAPLWGSTQCRQRLIFVAIREDAGSEPQLPEPTHGAVGEYFSYRERRMVAIADDPTSMLGEAPVTQRLAADLFPNGTRPPLSLGPAAIPTVENQLDGLPPLGTAEASRLGHIAWKHSPAQLKRMRGVAEGGQWKGGLDHFSHSYGRLHRRGLARTITTYFANPGSGRFWHPTENRALTLREAARLQGFPDSFLFPPAGSPGRVPKLVGNALDQRLADVVYLAVRQALE